MSKPACSCSIKTAMWPLGLFVVALSAVMFLRAGPAPTPPVFEADLTLADAINESRESAKAVFVLATADWCPPCQALKRGAMTDERVVGVLRQRTLPVYLDATESNSTGALEAARLGVSSLPTMLIIRDGEVLSSVVGAQTPDATLAWLDQALGE